jgi:hypothetical protein
MDLPCLICGEDVDNTPQTVPLVSPNADDDGTVLMVLVCSDCFDTLAERALRIPYRDICTMALEHEVSLS